MAENIEVNGREQIIDVFKVAEPSLKNSILMGIKTKNPKLYQELSLLNLQFEDLNKLENYDFQILLGQVPKKQLMLCLRLASIAFRQKVYACVTDKQIEEIEDYIQHGRKETLKKLKNEQDRVCQIALKLHQSGKIKLQPWRSDSWV